MSEFENNVVKELNEMKRRIDNLESENRRLELRLKKIEKEALTNDKLKRSLNMSGIRY